MRVSCSSTIRAIAATGMCGADPKTNASNNSVNPEPGRAHVRLVLEEVQMTPRLGLGVVHRARRLVTLRTGKPGTTGKVDAQIQPACSGSNVASTTRHGSTIPNPAANTSSLSTPQPFAMPDHDPKTATTETSQSP